MIGARPPPKSSPAAMTTPDAVAINGAGTVSAAMGPTVKVISALLKKWTMNRHVKSEAVVAATIPSKPSATSVPTLEITMTGLRPTRSDNAGRMIVPPIAPKPIADITVVI